MIRFIVVCISIYMFYLAGFDIHLASQHFAENSNQGFVNCTSAIIDAMIGSTLFIIDAVFSLNRIGGLLEKQAHLLGQSKSRTSS